MNEADFDLVLRAYQREAMTPEERESFYSLTGSQLNASNNVMPVAFDLLRDRKPALMRKLTPVQLVAFNLTIRS